MIRNASTGGSSVKDTTKLIAMLHKIGVIKGKKKSSKGALAKEDGIRQEHDMGKGYVSYAPQSAQGSAMNIMRNVPLLMNADQSGFNQQQIEDIRRGVGENFALLKDAMDKESMAGQQRYANLLFGTGALAQQMRQIGNDRFRPNEGVSSPTIEEMESEGDTIAPEDRPFNRSAGGVEPPESIMETDVEQTPKEIFADIDEEERIPIPQPIERQPEPSAPEPIRPPEPAPKVKAGRGASLFDSKAISEALLALELSDVAKNKSEINRLKPKQLNDFADRIRAIGGKLPTNFNSLTVDDKRFYISNELEKYGKNLYD